MENKSYFMYLTKHPDLIEEVFLSKEMIKTFTRFAKLDKKIHKLDNQKAQALVKVVTIKVSFKTKTC